MKLRPRYLSLACLLGLLATTPVWGQTENNTSTPAPLGGTPPAGEPIENALEEEVMRWGEPFSAQKAGMLSAAIPGLGQVYNGKAWKNILVYGAFAGAGYSAYINHQLYVDNLTSLYAEIDLDPATENLSGRSEIILRRNVNLTRRYRDYAYIAIAGVYALQIAEAFIDAHLSTFDLEDDLLAQHGMHIRPTVVTTPGYAGIGICLTLP